MPEATLYQAPAVMMDYTPTAAITAGDMICLPDGRAAYCPDAIAAGVKGAVQVGGIVKTDKTASIALLHGGDAYWDVSAAKAHFRPEAGTTDFYAGAVYGDFAGAGTYCYINLNLRTYHLINLGNGDGSGGDWLAQELAAGVAGSVDAYPGGGAKIVISNGNEVQANCILSARTVLGSSKPIFEARMTRAATTDAAVDLDLGLASSGHASDFEAVTYHAAFHSDGDDLVIDTHSDDNTTDRAPATSGVSLVEGTYNEFWIDGRDPANVLYYIDGVLIDTSASKRTLAAAGTYGAICMIEKTTGTAVGGATVTKMRVRTNVE